MRSKVSALMDGELAAGELDESLAALARDGEALEAWRTYHLISDALQGRSLLSASCLSRVAARLAAEPALIGPLPAEVAPPQRTRWFVPSALAASLAAVVLVGWMAFAPQPPRTVAPATVAKAPPAAAQPQVAKAPVRQPLTAATRDYLIAHQAFSPRNSLQGMAPYVRSVSADAGPGKP